MTMSGKINNLTYTINVTLPEKVIYSWTFRRTYFHKSGGNPADTYKVKSCAPRNKPYLFSLQSLSIQVPGADI